MKKFLKQLVSFLSPYSMASTDPLVAFTMSEEGKALLIDSRELEELRTGVIEGAIWIPASGTGSLDWVSDIKKLTDKESKIFIYGNYNQSAEKLAHIMEAHGFKVSVIGTFESLEERLPVRVMTEPSSVEIRPEDRAR